MLQILAKDDENLNLPFWFFSEDCREKVAECIVTREGLDTQDLKEHPDHVKAVFRESELLSLKHQICQYSLGHLDMLSLFANLHDLRASLRQYLDSDFGLCLLLLSLRAPLKPSCSPYVRSVACN